MDYIKGIFKSRTMLFSALLMIFGAIADNSDKIQGLLDAHTYNIIMLLVGVIIAILRFLTTLPLNQK